MEKRILETTIEIAKKLHKESIEKQNLVETIDEKIVIILYDVIEHTSMSFKELIDYGIPIYIIDSLKYLIKDKNVNYFVYIESIKENDLARKVKLANLKDIINKGYSISLLERYKGAVYIGKYSSDFY